MNDDMNKIIVVDDNLENLTVIKNTLKDMYEVYQAPSAAKMFDLLEHILPDLILLDVAMPDMNGYEALKLLKKNDKLREIPVIFLTSMNDPQSEMAGFDLGAVDYIHKPVIAPLLQQRIKTHTSLMEHQKMLQRRNQEIEKLLELRTQEIELRRKAEEEAYNASRAKSDFLSHMSHEIRTPLNAIIGMTGIASGTKDPDKIKYCLDRVSSASKHMLSIINDILDMSKIEANKFDLSNSEFNLEKMLMSIINVTNVRAEEKHQNFVVDLNVNVPPFIISDELRLSQVITNLLTNAIKFTPDNGTVILSIDTADESVDESAESSEVESGEDIILKISVADTGIGISEEQQERLFTSYNQADSSIANKFGGTGLGLAISKRIVELMQGKIWIESELGKGSKFLFTVKVKKGTGKNRTNLAAKINKEDIRILAVDDSEETRVYFIHLMKAYDLPYSIAASGTEALKLINENNGKPYNIFFVDWHMPNMDGIELTKKIREIYGDKVFVILFSTTDWNDIEADALAAGVNQFIPKPVFPSSLINAINDCIEINPNKESDIRDENGEIVFDFTGHTILIAEDVEINREILSTILEKTSVSIDFAENGKEAVSLFKNNPDKYTLVFMDVNMPEMDGYEATRTIRALPVKQAKDICIIAMTANVFREDIDKCLSAGMNDHIGKPINPVILYEKINENLGAKAPVP